MIAGLSAGSTREKLLNRTILGSGGAPIERILQMTKGVAYVFAS